MAFLSIDPQTQTLYCQDDWTLPHLMALKKALQQLAHADHLTAIDTQKINHMDMAGALVLQQLLAKQTNINTTLQPQHQALLTLIDNTALANSKMPKIAKDNFLVRIGKATVEKYQNFKAFLAFIGEAFYIGLQWLIRPKKIAWKSCLSIFETAGIHALPIVALLSFLIGGVLTYQMALQLRHYGANIYVVDLLGLSVLREFAPLMTAIIIAGRTSSAFAAQLGTMKLREEIDALQTMGISPNELLILPRLISLMIIMPLLTVWASIFAIMGGMLTAKLTLDVGYQDFLYRFYEAISVKSYYAGMIKAPVFGLTIAAIGCFQGFQVSQSAASIGVKTTLSVVQAIFFIIVVDAIFSLIFNWVGL